jgi:hypothetical protein
VAQKERKDPGNIDRFRESPDDVGSRFQRLFVAGDFFSESAISKRIQMIRSYENYVSLDARVNVCIFWFDSEIHGFDGE